jgi:hypothetical protein
MSCGLRLQTVCNYIYIVIIKFFREVRATIRFLLTLHKCTCLPSEKKGEESHNLHSGEPARNRSNSTGKSLSKSSVELKSYYARAQRARCLLFADWLAHGAPRAFPSGKRPNNDSCSAAIHPTEHVIVHLLLTIEIHLAHVTKRFLLHGLNRGTLSFCQRCLLCL